MHVNEDGLILKNAVDECTPEDESVGLILNTRAWSGIHMTTYKTRNP